MMYKQRYNEHKSGAKARGIAFDLSYEQWVEIWGDRIHMRGVGADQFGMLRTRDEGGYTVGNVRVGTPRDNQQERSVAVRVKKAQAPTGGYKCSPPRGKGDSWVHKRDVFKEYIEDGEEDC